MTTIVQDTFKKLVAKEWHIWVLICFVLSMYL